MPPRIPLLSALRAPSALFQASRATISSSAPSSAPGLRRDVPSATSSLLASVEDPAAGSGGPGPGQPDLTQAATDMYARVRQRPGAEGGERARRPAEEELSLRHDNEDYMRQLTRRWRAGDVYAPHDLSPSEMAKFRRNTARKRDLVDMLNLRPLDMYRNFSFISEFMTPHGRIKKSVETGLRPPNQRKVAKAIRRAIGLGIHPSVHRHPELLSISFGRIGVQHQVTRDKGLKV
ncbi:ribosomal protein S18 [Xylariomycetidae sp. FL0641]|nr:ribosomal protein S18 [Xylariomycetidae sp. FL0641]